jgi:ribosomal-protein-alanine N-acetyltransferase
MTRLQASRLQARRADAVRRKEHAPPAAQDRRRRTIPGDQVAMTTDPSIRLAAPGDAEAIAAMSRELIEYGLPWNWRPARVLRAIRHPETNVAVVRAHGELVAFGIMEYLEVEAHLVLFAVRGASQRKGIGSALLRWLEAAATVAGAQRIRLEARRENLAARTFYNEHGYHELVIRPARYSGAVDGIQLEKWLRPPARA